MPEQNTLKRLIGREIDIDRFDGGHDRGRLLNVNRRSLWLVVDEVEDRFVALADIAMLRPAS
jgi:hypothetical protein